MWSMVAATIAMHAGYNVYSSQTDAKLSDLALSNVDALAYDNEGDAEVICGKESGKCWLRNGYYFEGETPTTIA